MSLYTSVYTDKLRKENHGCKFVYEKKMNEVEEALTLPELTKSREAAGDIMKRVNTYIVTLSSVQL